KGKVQAAGDAHVSRFSVRKGFRVQRVVHPRFTGALSAMTFNERGDVIAARERGPLLLIRDSDADGAPDQVSVFSDAVKNCQGILCLNGYVYAVGESSEGAGFHRLTDQDGDGQADKVETFFKFTRGMSEHGPHAAVLGPEGLIYIAVGNHSEADVQIESTSPYANYYEGDLVKPRHEDAGGHAHGIKAPGGTVIRTDAEGTFCELFAGGLRNHYDLCFNRHGELFTFDSDMEWDEGLPWYRPTRVNHVTAGGEFGWRSGWAKFPEYYLDNLPAVLNVGRGSPTGMVCYDHHKFPSKYRDCVFACDWSQGRILSVFTKRRNGTYQATQETFLEGRPLNVTDVAVGPDGWLYFSTGGRGTEGGVYRVIYEGQVEQPPRERGVMAAIRTPQVQAAWSRDRVARMKETMGSRWAREIVKAAEDRKNSAEDRCRALDLMQLVGPFPDKMMLVRLSHENEPLVRAKAAYLMGIHINHRTNGRLVDLMDDPDPTFRRVACESILRSRHRPPISSLLKMLSERSRLLQWSAVRALQRLPRDEWGKAVLQSRDVRVFNMGAAGLLAVDPQPAVCRAILQRYRVFAKGHVEDEDFIDLLRVLQLVLDQGTFRAEELTALGEEIAEEYPAGDATMNRELLRILVFLQDPSVLKRGLAALEDPEWADVEKAHLAFHLSHLKKGWSPEQKLRLLGFYENARGQSGSHSLARYVDNIARDFTKGFSQSERSWVLSNGVKLPSVALQILKDFPQDLTDDQIASLIELDQRLAEQDADAKDADDLATGIAAVLGRSGREKSLDYLRSLFNEHPDRRTDVAMVLSSLPTVDRSENEKNWPLMVRALPVLDGVPAQMVLTALGKIPLRPKPKQPEAIRQVILAGLRL
ncbi:MAG: PQQ-dependent sugar dehydrogenase, partial [Planctomycetales bacterium]